LILVLTGARAPLFYAMAVSGLSLLSIRSRVFAARDRLALILAVLALLPVIALFAGSFAEIRLFNVVMNETSNLSGRDLLWPRFEEAAARSPWFGWGLGAGNEVVSQHSAVAQQLHTWAAHNEYLRIEVEGGALGRGLLIALFVAWVTVRTRDLPPPDRRIMRLAFIAYAGHAVTDNVLISTPACVMFAFTAAVFARQVPRGASSARPGIALPDSRLVA
jgi:O-antigen ligase